MILNNKELLNFIETFASEVTSSGFKLVSFNKNQPILEADRFIKHVYFVKEGVCKCVINEDNNKNYLVEFLGNGEIIGEIEAILDCKTITSVFAMTDVMVYKIELGIFKKLLLNSKNFNALLLAELATRLRNTALRSSFQQLNTVESALSKILQLQKEQNLTFSKKDLAEYLGISVRSLNRELLKLISK
jgi:CRP-like cAMP-binding protein